MIEVKGDEAYVAGSTNNIDIWVYMTIFFEMSYLRKIQIAFNSGKKYNIIIISLFPVNFPSTSLIIQFTTKLYFSVISMFFGMYCIWKPFIHCLH